MRWPFAPSSQTGDGFLARISPRVAQMERDWADIALEENREAETSVGTAVSRAMNEQGANAKAVMAKQIARLAVQARATARKAKQMAQVGGDGAATDSEIKIAEATVASFAWEAAAELAEAKATGGWTQATLSAVSLAVRISTEQVDAAATLTRHATGNQADRVQAAAKQWAKAAASWQATEGLVQKNLELHAGSRLYSQALPNGINIPAAMLIGLFAGSGIIFAMLRFRNGASTVDGKGLHEPLLIA